MTTLRVLLDAAHSPSRAAAWTLFDAQDHALSSGSGTPDVWPAADRREAVLAAGCVRIAALHLPPLDRDRANAAAVFALEDQLAGPASEQHIAVSPQAADGTLEAVIAARGLVAATAAQFARAVAEPALAPRPATGAWRWYASGSAGGFVRKPDGATFATFATGAAVALPPVLVLALAQAARATAPPLRVEVAFPAAAATLADWSRATGMAFVRVDPWRWQDAGAAAFAASPDLLQGEFARRVPVTAWRGTRVFRAAIVIVCAAAALQVSATLAEWAWLRFEHWRTDRALAALARDSGIAADTATPAAGLAQQLAAARHRAGFAARADALPLLARAAPALAALPAGALKTAAYGDGHWTFDVALPDPGAGASLEQRFNAAGLTTLQATRPGGLRVRVALEPGAR